MTAMKLTCLSKILVVLLLAQNVHSQLRVGFYRSSCSLAELIVKDEVKKAFIRDKGVAPGLVRLHFHDCFVRVSKSVQSLINHSFSL
jgi:peroxidase